MKIMYNARDMELYVCVGGSSEFSTKTKKSGADRKARHKVTFKVNKYTDNLECIR